MHFQLEHELSPRNTAPCPLRVRIYAYFYRAANHVINYGSFCPESIAGFTLNTGIGLSISTENMMILSSYIKIRP